MHKPLILNIIRPVTVLGALVPRYGDVFVSTLMRFCMNCKNENLWHRGFKTLESIMFMVQQLSLESTIHIIPTH